MALPKQLTDTANANVSQALQTGARGQTQTTTDYGVIGDAFFKKAQLDLQIADLNADMGYKKASLLSGLQMQKADLEMNKGQLLLNAAQMAEEQRRYEESQEVSDSEKFLGIIGGGAQGAMTGFALGGPPGAIIGGIAGGALTYGAYQSGGRPAGQQAQQTLGTVASLAGTYKAMQTEQVQQDAWKGIMKTGGDLIAQYNGAKTPSQQHAAMQAMDAHIGEVYQTAMSMPGANPEKVGTMVQNYRKGLEASVGMPTNEGAKRNEFKQLENMVQYQSDPRASDPKKQRQWANDYMKDSAIIYEESTGKQMPMWMAQRNFKAMSAETQAAQQPQKPSYGSMTQPAAISGGHQAMAPSASQQLPQAPNQPTPTRAPTPQQSAPTQSRWAPTRPSGPGVMMDDGGAQDSNYKAVQSEMNLTKQGGETAEIMSKEQGNIDLTNRPVVNNADGSISTEKSITIEEDGQFINIPTIVDGKEVSEKSAIAHFHKTGEHLGKFGSLEEAESEAEQTHLDQEDRYAGKKSFMDKMTTPYKDGEVTDSLTSVLPGNKDRGLEKIVRDKFNIRGPQKPPGDVNKEAKAYWQQSIDELPGDKATNQTLYTSTDPAIIADTLGTNGKDASTDAKRDKLVAFETGPANMNQLKEDSLNLNETINKHMPGATSEEKTELAKAFVMYKYGQGGPEGNMSMEGKGFGASGAGFGAQGQSFKKNYEMQLDKMGIKPDSPAAKEIFKSMMKVDSLSGPLAMQQAVATQGAKPTDKDVAMFNISNAIDRDPEMLIAGIHTQQRMMVQGIQRQLSRWETQGQKEDRYRAEGAAKRKPVGQDVKRGRFVSDFIPLDD